MPDEPWHWSLVAFLVVSGGLELLYSIKVFFPPTVPTLSFDTTICAGCHVALSLGLRVVSWVWCWAGGELETIRINWFRTSRSELQDMQFAVSYSKLGWLYGLVEEVITYWYFNGKALIQSINQCNVDKKKPLFMIQSCISRLQSKLDLLCWYFLIICDRKLEILEIITITKCPTCKVASHS